MGKVDFRRLSLRERGQLDEELMHILSALKKPQSIHSFFHDVLTPSELVMLGRRVRVAKLLMAGLPLLSICKQLQVGLTTVRSVDLWLQQKFENYRSVLSELYQEMQQQAKREKPIEPYTFRWVRKKYPMHFLLFNLLLDDIDWGRHWRKFQLATPYSPLKRQLKT